MLPSTSVNTPNAATQVSAPSVPKTAAPPQVSSSNKRTAPAPASPAPVPASPAPAPSPSTTISNLGKRKRGQNWSIEESFKLIEQVETDGKNWDKVLNALHAKHWVPHISDKTKLRTHFNDLARSGSIINREYTIPAFVPDPTVTAEENTKKKSAHDAKHQVIKAVSETPQSFSQ